MIIKAFEIVVFKNDYNFYGEILHIHVNTNYLKNIYCLYTISTNKNIYSRIFLRNNN